MNEYQTAIHAHEHGLYRQRQRQFRTTMRSSAILATGLVIMVTILSGGTWATLATCAALAAIVLALTFVAGRWVIRADGDQ